MLHPSCMNYQNRTRIRRIIAPVQHSTLVPDDNICGPPLEFHDEHDRLGLDPHHKCRECLYTQCNADAEVFSS